MTNSIEHTWHCPGCSGILGIIEGVGDKFYCSLCKEWLPFHDIVHTFKEETEDRITCMSTVLRNLTISTVDKCPKK